MEGVSLPKYGMFSAMMTDVPGCGLVLLLVITVFVAAPPACVVWHCCMILSAEFSGLQLKLRGPICVCLQRFCMA